jgi:hypothetical protein
MMCGINPPCDRPGAGCTGSIEFKSPLASAMVICCGNHHEAVKAWQTIGNQGGG